MQPEPIAAIERLEGEGVLADPPAGLLMLYAGVLLAAGGASLFLK